MLIEITSVSRTYQRGQELVKAVDDVTLTLGNENLSFFGRPALLLHRLDGGGAKELSSSTGFDRRSCRFVVRVR